MDYLTVFLATIILVLLLHIWNQTATMIRAWQELDALEKKYNAILAGTPCCTKWETCMRPCTPRGEKIAERRLSGDKSS